LCMSTSRHVAWHSLHWKLPRLERVRPMPERTKRDANMRSIRKVLGGGGHRARASRRTAYSTFSALNPTLVSRIRARVACPLLTRRPQNSLNTRRPAAWCQNPRFTEAPQTARVDQGDHSLRVGSLDVALALVEHAGGHYRVPVRLSRVPAPLWAMWHTVYRHAPGSVRHGGGAALRCRHGSGDCCVAAVSTIARISSGV
jgi:hypothetical protein